MHSAMVRARQHKGLVLLMVRCLLQSEPLRYFGQSHLRALNSREGRRSAHCCQSGPLQAHAHAARPLQGAIQRELHVLVCRVTAQVGAQPAPS